ncbi:MAG: ATP-binding protein [Pseudomonadota bacterium]
MEVTPGRLSEHDLDVSELWALLKLSVDGVFQWDSSTDEIHWSPAVHSLIGGLREGHCNIEHLLDQVHPEDRGRLRRALRESQESGQRMAIEVRMRRLDDVFVWVRAQGVWRPGTARPMQKFLGLIVSITNEKQSRAELQLEQERFRAFVDHCPAGVYMKGADRRTIVANDKAAEIAGCELDDLLGRTCYEMFDPETARKIDDEDSAVISEGLVRSWTGQVATRSGESRTIVDTKFPVVTEESGTLVGGFAIDVTEQENTRRRAESAQRLESLGLLAGGIAHDFNNLLAGVVGNAELAVPHADGSGREFLADLLSTAGRASALCDQLLLYAGRDIVLEERINIPAQLRSLVPMLETTMGGRAKLVVECPDADLGAPIDPVRFQQIVLNLVLNAVEACIGSKQCKVSIIVDLLDAGLEESVESSWLLDESAPMVRISVRDNGEGMPAHLIDRIFDPFFSTKTEGTGLGLAAVLGGVRSAGGGIAVRSIPDGGTTVSVYLPRLDAPPVASVGDELTSSPAPAKHRGRALVVDDEPMLTQVLGALLGRAGFDTETCNSGTEASALLAARLDDFDLLIFDLTMPETNGHDLLRQARKHRPAVPVILCSGYSEQDVSSALDEHTVFLHKPFSNRQLNETIRRLAP